MAKPKGYDLVKQFWKEYDRVVTPGNVDPRFYKTGTQGPPRKGKKELQELEQLTFGKTKKDYGVPTKSLVDYEGTPYISTMADRSGTHTITHVDGVELKEPIKLDGGQDYMFDDHEGVWASAEAPVTGIMKMANDLFARFGKNPIFIPHTMAPTGIDFSHHMPELMIKYARQNMSKADIEALNKQIREVPVVRKKTDKETGEETITVIKLDEFKGINHKDAIKQLGELTGDQRKKIIADMDRFRDRGALSAPKARVITSDPRQYGTKDGSLFNVGEIFAGKTPRLTGHGTYKYEVPGQGDAQLLEDITMFDLLDPEVPVREFDPKNPNRALSGFWNADNPTPQDMRAASMNPQMQHGIIDEKMLRRLESEGKLGKREAQAVKQVMNRQGGMATLPQLVRLGVLSATGLGLFTAASMVNAGVGKEVVEGFLDNMSKATKKDAAEDVVDYTLPSSKPPATNKTLDDELKDRMDKRGRYTPYQRDFKLPSDPEQRAAAKQNREVAGPLQEELHDAVQKLTGFGGDARAKVDNFGVLHYDDDVINILDEAGYGDLRHRIARHNETILGDEYRKGFQYEGLHGTTAKENFDEFLEQGTSGEFVNLTQNPRMAQGFAGGNEFSPKASKAELTVVDGVAYPHDHPKVLEAAGNRTLLIDANKGRNWTHKNDEQVWEIVNNIPLADKQEAVYQAKLQGVETNRPGWEVNLKGTPDDYIMTDEGMTTRQDLFNKIKTGDYQWIEDSNVVDSARHLGYDSFNVRELDDIGAEVAAQSAQNQHLAAWNIGVYDPRGGNLRGRFAPKDPAKAQSGHIMAATAPVGAIGVGTVLAPEETQAGGFSQRVKQEAQHLLNHGVRTESPGETATQLDEQRRLDQLAAEEYNNLITETGVSPTSAQHQQTLFDEAYRRAEQRMTAQPVASPAQSAKEDFVQRRSRRGGRSGNAMRRREANKNNPMSFGDRATQALNTMITNPAAQAATPERYRDLKEPVEGVFDLGGMTGDAFTDARIIATNLFSYDDQSRIDMIKAAVPELTDESFETFGDPNVRNGTITVVTFPNGQKRIVNKAGFSASDAAALATDLAMYTPAARVTRAGVTVGSRLARGAMANAATDATIQGIQAAAGGRDEWDAEQTAILGLSGLGFAAVDDVARGVGMLRNPGVKKGTTIVP